ncbi:MAG: hypothetical protein H7101_13065 [Deinococcales bacterium]|nr:hypothetical protein [Chitinophagaceae bacterium]
MLQNFGTALSREQMKMVVGGIRTLDEGGGPSCALTTIDATCGCVAASCKCQSGIGLPQGQMPGCISTWSDGSCTMATSNDCHG